MVNDRKRFVPPRPNWTPPTLATSAYIVGFEPHPPRWKERTVRLILALVAALVLAAAPVAADEDPSGICVGGLQVVACVPPETG
jgi:hypothetical protein